MGGDGSPPEAAGLLHDLSNAVAGALRLTECARGRLPAGHAARDDVAAAVAACRQAADLVREIVEGVPREAGVADLNAVAAEGIEVVRRSRGAPVRHVPSATPLRVRMGTAAARRIVDNLLLNAADAIEGTAGEIVVTVGTAPCGRALLEVRDGGKGMAPDTAARIFEPGFTTRPDGRGIGLKVVRSLLERSGGDISVETGEGRG